MAWSVAASHLHAHSPYQCDLLEIEGHVGVEVGDLYLLNWDSLEIAREKSVACRSGVNYRLCVSMGFGLIIPFLLDLCGPWYLL